MRKTKKFIVTLLCLVALFVFPTNAYAANDTYTVQGSLAQIQLQFDAVHSPLSRAKEYNVTYSDNAWGTEQIIQIYSDDINHFDIQYNVLGGGTISSASDDGSLLLYNSNNKLVAAVDSIRVEDFWGNEVSATCSNTTESATYILDTAEATFPLTAKIQVYSVDDFYRWFSDGYWWVNGGMDSVHLVPTDGWHGIGSSTGVVTWSWNTVYNKFSGDSRWSNTQGMSEQYQCHVLGASYKDAWNLEPARPCVGITATIQASCNP